MLWLPVLTIEKSKPGAGADTVNVKAVERVKEPLVAVTVTVDAAAGVEADVVSVSVVEQVAVHDAGANAAVVPAGRSDVVNEIGCAVPDTSVAPTVLVIA